MSFRVIEISEAGQHVALDRGFLVVFKEREERGRVPLDDISVLLLSGFGLSLSTPLANALLDRKVTVIFCGANYHPSGMLWPVESHGLPGERLRLQMDASLPLQKRLWQALVRQKIRMQGEILTHFFRGDAGLLALSTRILSGDSSNLEAQAARRYWPALFGMDFRRNTDGDGLNAALNYGYAVLRAALARAVAAAGLNPTLGVFHKNLSNPFCLVDDLIEPFRPIVDGLVKKEIKPETKTLGPEEKRCLASILGLDFETNRGRSPLSQVLQILVQSFVTSLREKEPVFEFPSLGLPLVWLNQIQIQEE